MEPSRLHAVIMAGGSGTRFWPRSRRALPKQFLKMGGPRSLLRETYERVLPLTGAGRVLVITGRDHLARVREELPELPSASLLGEPVGRDTAACIGLAAEWISYGRAVSGDAGSGGSGDLAAAPGEVPILLVCPADHRIPDAALFRDAVRSAADLARSTAELVTLGIPPRGPSSAFGYIQRGPALRTGPLPAYRALRFLEKPDRARAEECFRGGDHYWNCGIFIWRIDAIRSAIARHFPQLSEGLEPLGRLFREGVAVEEALNRTFPALARNSVDRGVLEKAAACGEVAVVEAPFEWDDVGSWNSLERCLPADAGGNHVEGRHVGLDTTGCLISGSSRRLVATIGLRDLVVVETEDAVLVCRRDEAERVKDLVALLEARGEGQLA